MMRLIWIALLGSLWLACYPEASLGRAEQAVDTGSGSEDCVYDDVDCFSAQPDACTTPAATQKSCPGPGPCSGRQMAANSSACELVTGPLQCTGSLEHVACSMSNGQCKATVRGCPWDQPCTLGEPVEETCPEEYTPPPYPDLPGDLVPCEQRVRTTYTTCHEYQYRACRPSGSLEYVSCYEP